MFSSMVSNGNDTHNFILAFVGSKGTYERILQWVIFLYAQNIADGVPDTGTYADSTEPCWSAIQCRDANSYPLGGTSEDPGECK
jgi:hypothetical protein